VSDISSISASIPPWQILSEDGPVLAINKPAGLLTLGAAPRIPTLERQIKDYLKQKYGKPGNVYLGVVHRLDRPVSGVILFTRNSKAAGRLAEQFRERQIEKTYWGITDREPEEQSGTLIDWLLKVPDKAEVEVVAPETVGARQAVLHYRVVGKTPLGSLLEIQLETGRMHQIRVQLASRGWPIRGDIQYGSTQYLADPPPEELTANPIALHARQIRFLHPVRYDSVTIAAPVPANWGDLGRSTDEIVSETPHVFPEIPVVPDWDDEEG
jgi:23S rRNA pseudouridine1911/1915/1917 synthase